MKNTLDYNEDKVSKNVAERIMVSGIPNNDCDSVYDVFGEYERRNIRTEKLSFQMSINPDHENGENLSNRQIKELTKQIMEELGYGNQPYVIYLHHDIDREHYHVVSIRTDEKGKKIRDFYEKKKLQEILKDLEKEFGFKIGKDAKTKGKTNVNAEIQDNSSDKRFTPKSKNVIEQYISAYENAMNYRFTTFTQFKAIMQWYGINVEKRQDKITDTIAFQGLDNNNQPCTTFMTQAEMGHEDMLSRIAAKAEMEKKAKYRLLKERKETADIVRRCIMNSKDENDFEKRLKKNNIGILISRNRDKVIFGVTFVNHSQKMSFKGTELSKEMNATLFRALEANGWIPSAVFDEEKREIERYRSLGLTDSINSTYPIEDDNPIIRDDDIREILDTTGEILSFTAGILSSIDSGTTEQNSDAKRPRRRKNEKKKKFKFD